MMYCVYCGGEILGDGYTSAMHCENAEETLYEFNEPDAEIALCGYRMSDTARDFFVWEIQKLKAELSELKAVKFKYFEDNECWIYQEDGDNNFESLVCPVVISARKLIELGLT